MSRQKAHVPPLRGPASKPQPYSSITARSSGLGDTPELPPRHTQRNSRSETATSARTKAMDISATANSYNQTLRQDGSALRLSASDSKFLATGKPMLLKEFSKGKSVRDLPCLVKVVGGHRSLCERYSFGREQMFMILEKKSMPVVTCKDHKGGSSCAVPLNTTFFHLVPYCMDTEGIRPRNLGKITASELLQSKALPPVIAVSKEFEASEHHSKKRVPVGTLLFPKDKIQQLKDQQQWVLHAMSQSGEMVQITPDCNGYFSILARNVRLSLRQALDHLKPPFTMQTISDCDKLYVNVVTVEKVHKEDVFIGMMKATEGTSIDDVSTFSRMAEVPVSLNLKVVIMVPKQQELLDKIYDFARSEYDRVTHSPSRGIWQACADTVLMTLNPAYIDIFMAKDCLNEKFRASPASYVKPAPSTPSARTLPITPVQLSMATPHNKEEHIYDAVDNYMAIATASPNTEAAGTQLRTEQPLSDAAAIEYYEAIPIVEANQEKMCPSSEDAKTPFRSDPSPSGASAVEYFEEMPTAEEQQKMSESEAAGTLIESKQILLEENVAYLKTMQRGDILQLLDAMNLSIYKEAFEQEQIDGEMMSCLSADMLSELGVSKALHRLRLMKIVHGETSASSFFLFPE